MMTGWRIEAPREARGMIRHVAGWLAVVVLLGISTGHAAPAPSFADIRFTNERPMRFDAASVELVKDFKPTFRSPEVEHLFPVPPELAVENWVHDRLVAAGSGRRVVVHLVDASVREIDLPKTPGLRGLFTTDQAQRYDGTIAVRIDLIDEHGVPEGSIMERRTRSQTVPEGITANQRDQTWYEMTRAMMADLDRQLERRIRENFTSVVQ